MRVTMYLVASIVSEPAAEAECLGEGGKERIMYS